MTPASGVGIDPLPDIQIALLRGINVGTAKRVGMADLRSLLGSLGFGEVRTLLNSGNIVYQGNGIPPSAAASRIEQALAQELKVKSRILVLTAAALETITLGNPLIQLATNPSRFFVSFLYDRTDAARLERLETTDWTPEALAIGNGAVYQWCPKGTSASALAGAVGKLLGDAVTTRNWATVMKLNAMARA